jgi:hypothetical protein
LTLVLCIGSSWQLGAEVQLYFLDASDEVILQRLAKRNAQRPPKTFHVTEAAFRMWRPLLEAPHADERAVSIVENEPSRAGDRLPSLPTNIAGCVTTAAGHCAPIVVPEHLRKYEKWLPAKP